MTAPTRERSPYVELSVPAPADAAAALAGLARTATADHVGYERAGTAEWAEGELCAVDVDGGGVTVRHDGGEQRFPAGGDLIGALDSALAALPVDGWRAYGWAGFELGHALHGGPADGPLVHLTVPRTEVRIADGTAHVRAVDRADADAVVARLAAAVPGAGSAARVAVDLAHDARHYRLSVAEAVAAIRAGELDKVIVSRVVPVHGEIDLPATYLVGRRGNDPARSFLLRQAGWEVAGFSPEILAHVDAEGGVRTQPLAGTRALLGDPVGDGRRRAELYRDSKEVFEHAVSVRLAAAELAQVCAPGTVAVRDFMSVRERGSVQHLASHLAGTLAPGRTPWHALAALFPAVTASGIPKAQACALIRRLEPVPRGPYGGVVLAVGSDGTLDAALVLRSVFRRDGRTWLRAGAGIVAQSDPDRELEETREKLLSVSRFLVAAGGGR